MKFRPLYDHIVVKPTEAPERTAGGLLIPDSAKEKPQEGEVLSVGNGKRMEDGRLAAPEVKPGDRVLFARYAGNEVRLEGEGFVIIREGDVLGVLSPAVELGGTRE